MRLRLSCLAVAAILSLSVGEAPAQLLQPIYQRIDDTVNELKKGNKSLSDMTAMLGRLQGNLDDGYYKDQVGDLIHQAGGVAQISGQALIDFTRERLITDLGRLKRRALGQPEPEREPKLTSFETSKIDLRNQARSTVTLVGWNLDVTRAHPDRYKIQIVNDTEKARDIDPKYLTLQGQYAMTIDVSSTGIPLKDHDRKLSFKGYSEPFELAIVNSDPLPVEKIESINLSLTTTNQDREGGFAIAEICDDGGNPVWSKKFSEYPRWKDWHSVTHSVAGLNTDLPKAPHFRVTLTQDGAKEKNILWRFNARIELRTNLGNKIVFEQNGLTLHCGDGRPSTVRILVNRLP